MNKKEVEFKEFFKVLGDALSNGAVVKKLDDPIHLKCGFVVDESEHYLMRVTGLKHAVDAGIDISNYFSLS